MKTFKIPTLFTFMGAIALAMVWFEDRLVDFFSIRKHRIVWSDFMRWLTEDPMYSNDAWIATYRLIESLVALYRVAVVGIFVFMAVFAIVHYVKGKNRLASASLVALTALFFTAQFHVPIIDHSKHTECYFGDEWFIQIGWYRLGELNEPSVFHYDVGDNETIYRIIIGRGRGSRNRAVRVHLNSEERTGVLHFTFFVWLNENGRLSGEDTKMEKSFPLNSRQYRELTRAFSRHRFWNTPSTAEYRGRGWYFVIEGKDSNRYHVVSRSNPRFGNVWQLGDFLHEYAFSLLRDSDYIIDWAFR